jgi:hypothetical protein
MKFPVDEKIKGLINKKRININHAVALEQE